MKKVLLSITAIVYFLISSGVVINLHYCMNRLDSAEFYGGKSDRCSKCGMHTSKAKGCCHDEVKIVKLQDDQKMQQFAFGFKEFTPAIVLPSTYIVLPFYNAGAVLVYEDHSPPLFTVENIYLHNCVFRI